VYDLLLLIFGKYGVIILMVNQQYAYISHCQINYLFILFYRDFDFAAHERFALL